MIEEGGWLRRHHRENNISLASLSWCASGDQQCQSDQVIPSAAGTTN